MPELIIDMDDAVKRTKLINGLSKLRGPWRVDYRRYRSRRSDRQNRYYWPCFVHQLAAWMRDNGHDVTDDQAHEVLKHKFLRQARKDVNGNELVYTLSTTQLDTTQFNEYLDNCARWLAEFCGIVVPEPDEYREREKQSVA